MMKNAIEWLEKAAWKNNVESKSALGTLYYELVRRVDLSAAVFSLVVDTIPFHDRDFKSPSAERKAVFR